MANLFGGCPLIMTSLCPRRVFSCDCTHHFTHTARCQSPDTHRKTRQSLLGKFLSNMSLLTSVTVTFMRTCPYLCFSLAQTADFRVSLLKLASNQFKCLFYSHSFMCFWVQCDYFREGYDQDTTMIYFMPLHCV